MGIEQAQEALNQGLENKEAESSNGSDSAPEATNNQQTAQQLIDLDAMDKVKWQGKELTKEELKKAFMFQSDYTKKTQELSKERQYADNLSYDLEKVLRDPSLADAFKEIYPKKYHAALERVLSFTQSTKQAPVQEQQSQRPDPFLQEKISQLDRHDKMLKDLMTNYESKEIEAIDAKLESMAQKFSQEFPLAEEPTVLAKAEILLERKRENGEKLNISDDEWKGLWKAEHEKQEKAFNGYYEKKFKQQTTASKKGRDVGPGGGTPGQAPKRETMKEATERAIRDFSGRG